MGVALLGNGLEGSPLIVAEGFCADALGGQHLKGGGHSSLRPVMSDERGEIGVLGKSDGRQGISELSLEPAKLGRCLHGELEIGGKGAGRRKDAAVVLHSRVDLLEE